MLTFTNYRIASREEGKALVLADSQQLPPKGAYALVPFKPSESDAVIFDRAATKLALLAA